MTAAIQQASSVRVDMQLKLSRFALPPVQSALVVGKRASIGAGALRNALDEAMPGAFIHIEVEHPVIEAILIRSAHLRRVPTEHLVPVLIRNAEAFMGETDTMHFDIGIEVQMQESIEF